MKVFQIDIPDFQKDEFFFPLRDKIDYAKLILLSARNLIIDYELTKSDTNCKMKLVVQKMSRLFFYDEKKYYSVSFPFNILTNEENKITEILTYSGKSIDSRSISTLMAILNDETFKLNPSPIEYFLNANGENIYGIDLLEEIFQFEPSYIRYDYDPKNVNGKIHPLNHLDLNYSSYGTYKIGLNDSIKNEYFEDILNTLTDCCFIT